MNDYLEQLKKDNLEKQELLVNKKTELQIKQKSKELDSQLNSFDKNKKNWNSDQMKAKIKFWAIAIVCGIFGSVVFYKIIGKFFG